MNARQSIWATLFALAAAVGAVAAAEPHVNFPDPDVDVRVAAQETEDPGAARYPPGLIRPAEGTPGAVPAEVPADVPWLRGTVVLDAQSSPSGAAFVLAEILKSPETVRDSYDELVDRTPAVPVISAEDEDDSTWQRTFVTSSWEVTVVGRPATSGVNNRTHITVTVRELL